jgi:hypothetical protein
MISFEILNFIIYIYNVINETMKTKTMKIKTMKIKTTKKSELITPKIAMQYMD